MAHNFRENRDNAVYIAKGGDNRSVTFVANGSELVTKTLFGSTRQGTHGWVFTRLDDTPLSIGTLAVQTALTSLSGGIKAKKIISELTVGSIISVVIHWGAAGSSTPISPSVTGATNIRDAVANSQFQTRIMWLTVPPSKEIEITFPNSLNSFYLSQIFFIQGVANNTNNTWFVNTSNTTSGFRNDTYFNTVVNSLIYRNRTLSVGALNNLGQGGAIAIYPFVTNDNNIFELANDNGYGASDTPASELGTFRDSSGVENGWQCVQPFNSDGSLRSDFLPRVNTLDISLNPYANIVFGSGHYVGDFAINTASAIRKDLLFDGLVKWTFTGNTVLQNTVDVISINDNNENYIYLDGAGYTIVWSTNNQTPGSSQRYYKCILENIAGMNRTFAGNKTARFEDCVFVNNTSFNTGITLQVTISILNSVIFNTVFLNMISVSSAVSCTLLNSFVSENSSFFMDKYFNPASSRFLNNNFMGKIIIGANTYELKRDKAGVLIPSRVGNGILDLQSIDGSVYTRGNYAQNPEYINLSGGDYWTVLPSSPMITNNNLFGANIGSCRVANNVLKANDNSIFVTPTGSGIDLVGDNLEYTGAGTNGNITSSIIDLGKQITLDDTKFIMDLNFNSDSARGAVDNNNVTVVNDYSLDLTNDGRIPARLTYRMRWSNKSTQPTTDSDWDNGGYLTAGTYGLFEVNQPPRVSISRNNNLLIVGNGEPDFIIEKSNKIKARWVQLFIVIYKGIKIN